MQELRDFAIYLAQESGKIVKSYFRTGFNVEIKDDDSPVTIADRKAEEAMRRLIEKHYPDHGILGEEFGNTNEDAEYRWVLDPIDGTKSFVHGATTFGTLIALMQNGTPILGIIHQPVLHEMMIGNNDETTLNDRKVTVRDTRSLADATLLATDHLDMHKYQDGERYEAFIRKVKLYRLWGDCYGYALLAAGLADIMIDAIMSTWDITALVPIIRGAGGVVTDYQGNDPVNANSIIAATPGLHAEVIKQLNG